MDRWVPMPDLIVVRPGSGDVGYATWGSHVIRCYRSLRYPASVIVIMGSCVLLVLNCGSSSIKYALFDVQREGVPRDALWSGKIDRIGTASPSYQESGQNAEAIALDTQKPYQSALGLIRE